MKRIVKNITSMRKTLIVLCMLFSASALAYDFSAVAPTGQRLYYEIISSTSPRTVAVVYPSGSFDSPWSGFTEPIGALTIPSSVSYSGNTYSVTEIWGYAFRDCSGLTSVTIPSSVTSIGDYAFYNCSGLSSLTIPNSVTSIRDYAFYGCTGLDSLYIGSGLSTIGENAFSYGINFSWLHYNAKNAHASNGNDWPHTNSVGYQSWFSSITELIIGDSVEHIPGHIFKQCQQIHKLVIPDNVETIGEQAFYGCTNIDSLYIGTGLESFGNYAFTYVNVSFLYYNAIQMVSPLNSVFQGSALIIGDSVQVIPEQMFQYNNHLMRLNIPNSVETIGEYAFYGCDSLENIIIGNSISQIGSHAFGHYINHERNIKKLTIQGTQTLQMDSTSFENCRIDTLEYNANPNFLTKKYFNCNNVLVVGDSVLTIVPNAFANTNIKDISILGHATTIGENAFAGCSIKRLYYNGNNNYLSKDVFGYGLQNVVLGDSIHDIYDNAFRSCHHLKNIELTSTLSSIGISAFKGCDSLQSIVLPQTVQSIGDSAFYGCQRLVSANIPNNISIINNAVFSGCSSLSGTLTIPSSVTSIGQSAFQNCSHLTGTLNIPESVNSIGQSAFNGCSGLTSLTTNNGLVEIGNYAFNGCSGLTSVTLNNGLVEIGDYAFNGCSGISNNVVLPNTLSIIGNHAFDGCSNMTGTMVIPSSLTAMGTYAFRNCSHLTGLTLQDTLSYIPDFAFYGCSGMSDSVSISSNVQAIGTSAFENCTNISGTLRIPNSVQHIGNKAFKNCDNILFLQTQDAAMTLGNEAFAQCDRLTEVDLGSSTTTIGSNAFQGCFRMSNVEMGNNVTNIGNYAFDGCVRLTNPTLSSSLTTIGNNAFQGCSLINGELVFPANVTSIGSNAFSNVGTISMLKMEGSVPPTIYSNTFNGISTATLVRVPCGSVLNYYVTNYWENFSNIVEFLPYEIFVESSNEVMGTAIVTQQPTCNDHSAIIQANAQTSYHFLQWSDGNTDNPRTIQMTQDSSFTAVFAPNMSYIEVTPNDPSMGSTTGTGTYGYNAPVTMTATALNGYHFLKWNDGNTQNPRHIIAFCDTTFTAVFVSNVSTITVANANPEFGNVSGSGVYYYQNIVNLTATSNYGYHFAHWNDDNTQNPRTIIVSQDSSFTAYFAVNTYSIVGSSNSTTMGSVSGGGVYAYLHEMSITATPAYGYHFVQWNDGNTNNPRTILVTRDSVFTAQFAANTYALTVEANDPTMGSAYGAGTYNYNSQVNLTAVATYGYHFIQWSDGNTDNPRIVTVNNNATYIAQFAINSYVITVGSSNPAFGTAAGGGSYNYLTPVNITATPNIGYHFTQWSDGNTDNPRNISVTQNATYTAQFAINSYAIAVESNNSTRGTVTGSGTYNHFASDTLTATPFYGYHFTQWNDGNTDNPRIIVVTAPATFTAQFDLNNYQVIGTSTDMTMGVVTGGGAYGYQSQVALSAVASPHYHFMMWQDSMTINPRTITVTRDTLFTAHFAIDSHRVNVASADTMMGAVAGGGDIPYNTQVWISATANYGYHFTQWNDGNTSNPRHILVTQDSNFTAQFANNDYHATVTSDDEVMGSVNGGGTYPYLTNLNLNATANYGYHFVQWSDSNMQNPRTLVLTCDTALVGQFAINQYEISATASDTLMGEVIGGGSYNYLSQVSLMAVAAMHHHFVQWSDGNTTNPRLVTVTADSNFVAQFAEDTRYTIIAESNDNTRGRVTGGGSYYSGDDATLTATAFEHYHFSQWSDGNTSNPRMVRVVSDASYTALFDPDIFTVTVSPNDPTMGAVYGGGEYAWGTEVQLTARAFPGYGFRSWNDGDTHVVRTIAVIADAEYQAIFYDAVGIAEAVTWNYSVTTQGLKLIVNGAENRSLSVYDITGRIIHHNTHSEDSATITLPASGVYLLQVEGCKARKIVVR